ncbi:MAG: helix-turn-helix domain-containing protein [Candidatus ainarchaeum sp.]|nr:helix-turn-helix domain-containing protein [Candidatus ainarchaeum sp.]
MVNLQCNQISTKELIKCVFGLKKTELKIFLLLLKEKKGISGNNIAKEIKLDRTTIQKSITLLLDKKIVLRRQINLNTGGYNFVYSINEKEKLQEMIKKIIEDWKIVAEKQLENIFEN